MNKLKIFCFSLSLFLSFTITFWIGINLNNLKEIDQWIMHKFSSIIPLNGSREFYESYFTLRNNQLDLAEWHGHQSIISLNPVSYPIMVKINVPLNSEMSVFLKNSHQKGAFFGIRIEQDKIFEISGVDDFKYTKKILRMTRGAPQLEIKIEQTNADQIGFWVDSTKVSNITIEKSDFYLNIRGGLKSSVVSSIKMENLLFTFSPKFRWTYFFIFSIAFLILTFFVTVKIIFPFYLALLTFIFPLIMYDQLYLRQRIPVTSLEKDIDSIKQSLFSIFRKNKYDIEHKYFFPNYKILKSGFRFNEKNWPSPYIHKESSEIDFDFIKNLNTRNILFLGASQTYGVGTSELALAFPIIYQKKMNQEKSCQFNLFNISFPGANSQTLLPHLKKVFEKSKFNAIFFNLVLNDYKQSGTESLLKILYEYSQQNNTPLFIIREPLDKSSSEEELLNLAFRRIDEFAKAKQLKLIDLHNHLNSQKMLGQFWWDKVHLTDYGNEVSAEFLWNQKLVNSKCSFALKDF